jgi:hypothetical protein
MPHRYPRVQVCPTEAEIDKAGPGLAMTAALLQLALQQTDGTPPCYMFIYAICTHATMIETDFVNVLFFLHILPLRGVHMHGCNALVDRDVLANVFTSNHDSGRHLPWRGLVMSPQI